MKYLSFKNDDQIPMIGLGTWKSAPGKVYEAVLAAIEAGYRHIDCAAIYGNETEIGKALQKVMNDGIVKREELWITSKLWNDSHQAAHVKPALEQTLKDLQLDYLDLYLVHWPVTLRHGVTYPRSRADFISLEEAPLGETWTAMETCAKLGMSRHLGVSNFNIDKIKEIQRQADIQPEMNQIELHPFLPQDKLINYCKENGILVTAYSPLGSRDRPEASKKADEPNLFTEPTIQKIAKKHNCSAPQVLINWAVHRDTIVIPKSTTPSHIQQNIESIHVSLDAADMQAIKNIEQTYRFLDGGLWTKYDSPFEMTDLWEA